MCVHGEDEEDWADGHKWWLGNGVLTFWKKGFGCVVNEGGGGADERKVSQISGVEMVKGKMVVIVGGGDSRDGRCHRRS